MVMTRASLPKNMEAAQYNFFAETYKDKPQMWKKLFKVENTSKGYEDDVQLVGFGAAQQTNEGSAFAEDALKEGFSKRYTVVKVGLSYAFTQETIDDGQYGSLVQKASKSAARSMVQAKEILHASVLNNAFATSGYTGGDGVTLCSASHPLTGVTYGASTFSNRLSVAADLSESALEDMIVGINNFTDDRGLLIDVGAKMLVVPNALQFTAERILASALRSDSANNDINAIKNMRVLPEGYMKWAYLSDTDAFFIMTDVDDGLKHYKRKGISSEVVPDGNVQVLRTNWSERFALGWTDPRCVYGSPGGGS